MKILLNLAKFTGETRVEITGGEPFEAGRHRFDAIAHYERNNVLNDDLMH